MTLIPTHGLRYTILPVHPHTFVPFWSLIGVAGRRQAVRMYIGEVASVSPEAAQTCTEI